MGKACWPVGRKVTERYLGPVFAPIRIFRKLISDLAGNSSIAKHTNQTLEWPEKSETAKRYMKQLLYAALVTHSDVDFT